MKITFLVYRPDLSGGARVISIYAYMLKKRGHEVKIISQPNPKTTLGDKLKSILKLKLFNKINDNKNHFSNSDIDYQTIDGQRPIVDTDLPDADVVIATWWETAYWVSALSPQKGQKFYFVQHHEVHGHLPWQISRGTYYLPLKKITISNWLIDIMAEEYGDQNVALVPNGVDRTMFHAPSRARQPIPTVGLMYSPAHFKGVDIIFRALEKAREQLPELQLVAFGASDPTAQLPLPKDTRYIRAPEQTKIRDIYSACDAWLFGSRKEGFGLPLLEAMACRTPVIATRAGAAPDLIVDGLNGHLVDIDDSTAMAERLLDVLSLPQSDWQSMSDAASVTAEKHGWETAAERFEQVLLDACGQA